MKFKSIQRGQPGVKGGGKKKYYAMPVTDGEVDIESLTKAIEKISTVSGADIRACLYALVDVSQTFLSDGKIVRLGDLGSFRVSFGSEGKDEEKEVTASCIKSEKILFRPGKALRNMLKVLSFRKVESTS